MAEIKHTFQAGKMNKDLDERLVPQGEYRDALNIEVRTSDNSDVGAVQNLYANKERLPKSSYDLDSELNKVYSKVNPTINGYGFKSEVIGSIVNDKTNKAYLFVSAPAPPGLRSTGFSDYIKNLKDIRIFKDMIIEYNSETKSIRPVVVDVFSVEFPKEKLTTDNGSTSVAYDSIVVTNGSLAYVRVGMYMRVYNANGGIIPTRSHPHHADTKESLGVRIIKIDYSANRIYFNKKVVGDLTDAKMFSFVAEPVLNFKRLHATEEGDASLLSSQITGINIINNLLFWTDGFSEPKKIHIQLCKQGTTNRMTGVNGKINPFDRHTDLIVKAGDNQGPLKLDHITVIRRAPRTAPNLVMSTNESGDEGLKVSDVAVHFQEGGSLFNNAGILLSTGDEVILKFQTQSFNQGDDVIITCSDQSGDPVSFTVTITSFQDSEATCTINSIDSNINESHLNWTASLSQIKPLFELKLGRFSYRYKYSNGEYSSFAPWSELAFLPGPFDYIPKKGYNLGMVNNLRYLKIKDFIVEDDQRPDDVFEVDILYKDTVSPNCYVVRSINKYNDDEWNQVTTGNNQGSLKITSEMIHRTLPSNQILRAWDNVPRRAKAQEITGNRVVYGNYLQNYNVTNQKTWFVRQWSYSTPHPGENPTSENKFKALSDSSPSSTPFQDTYLGYKSVKSIRDYKIGVVFGDRFGRETPVVGIGGSNKNAGTDIINYSSSINIDKKKSASVNRLVAQLDGFNPPYWAAYFKFYVKETTNEYYNLSMDRWYNAEDGNIWLSFQSADRNKVDIETYLILKNVHGSNDPVFDKARYKILAIESEAPDFIKTTHRIMGTVPLTENEGNVFNNIHETMVIVLGEDSFNSIFRQSFGNLNDDRGNGISWARIRAIKSGEVKYSEWVKIAGVKHDQDSGGSFTTIDPFGMNFEEAFGGSPDSYAVEVRVSTSENRPEFDGRFFVKIYKDATLSRTVLLSTKDGMVYNVTRNLKSFYLSPTKHNPADITAAYKGDYTSITPDGATNEFPATATKNYTEGAGDDYSRWGWDQSVRPSDKSWGYHHHGGDVDHLEDLSCNNTYISKVDDFWKEFKAQRLNSSNYTAVWFLDDMTWCDDKGDSGSYYTVRNRSLTNSFGAGNDVVSGYNRLTFSKIHKSGSSNDSDAEAYFRNAFTPGTLFRFPADPNKVVYQMGQVTSLQSKGYNINQKETNIVGGDTGGGSNCIRGEGGHGYSRRSSFGVDFFQLYNPNIGIDTSVWDPRSAVRHDARDVNHDGSATNTELAIEIVEEHFDLAESIETAQDNAIWETEPKEDVGMDLYYEATNAIPFHLTESNNESFIPVRQVEDKGLNTNPEVVINNHVGKISIIFNMNADYPNFPIVHSVYRDVIGIRGYQSNAPFPFKVMTGDTVRFTHNNGMITETIIKDHWNPVTSSTDSYSKSLTFSENITVGEDGYGKILTSSLTDSTNFTTSSSKIWQVTSDDFNENVRVFAEEIMTSGLYTIIRFVLTKPTSTIENLFDLSEEVDEWEGTVGINILGVSSSPVVQMKFEEITGYFRLDHFLGNKKVVLPWFNCYSFGNGLESDRIRDDFNAPTIDNGVKVSTGLDTYGQEHRASGMIYSGIYNSNSGVNNLNEFNMAESITKDLNPMYGSIQALKTRDTNVVAFCEDKVFQILANKDALYNADGSMNVTASNAVLGDAKAFVGDFGISLNPESLAVDGYRMYFTDRQRGKVLRLSQDGLTPISDVGMKSWFRNELKPSKSLINLIGSFDTVKGEYNLSFKHSIEYLENANEFNQTNYQDIQQGEIDALVTDTTVSFSEGSKGWSSFKSFVTENAFSINEEYITCDKARLWSHHYQEKTSEGPNLVEDSTFLNIVSNPYNSPSWTTTTVDGLTSSQEIVEGGALKMSTPTGGNNLSKINAVGRKGKKYKLTHNAYNFTGVSDTGRILLDSEQGGSTSEFQFNEGSSSSTSSITFTAYKDFTHIQYICKDNDSSITINNVSLVEVFDEPIKLANNFYGVQYDSTIDVLFNEMPGSVKSFNTINYEGTQARVQSFITESTTDAAGNVLSSLTDGEYYNLSDKDGWYVDSFVTDLQQAEVNGFIDKENKWFNNITGFATTLSNLDTSEFSVQGIGVASDITEAAVEKFKLTITEIS